MEKEQRPAAEVVLTVLHAGGKFGDGGGYKVSGGLHGVGVSVVNALSERLDLTIWRDGHEWTQSYERGAPHERAHEGRGQRPARHAASPSCPTSRSSRRSTTTARSSSSASARWRSSPGPAGSTSRDERGERLRDELPVRRRHRGLRQVPPRQGTQGPAPQEDRLRGGGRATSARSRSRSSGTTPTRRALLSFANNINTHEGGTHLSGFRSALTRTINAYAARRSGELKEKDENLQGEDVREGLTAIISVKIRDPQFEGQTKTKLGNPPVEGFVQAAVNRGLAEFLEENPTDGTRDHPQGGRRRARPRGRAQGPRPHPAQVGARELDAARASSPTARSAIPRSRRSSSSRATRPAARPSRAATATRRRSCRCAARSSTSRRTASTRCSPTRRSRR